MYLQTYNIMSKYISQFTVIKHLFSSLCTRPKFVTAFATVSQLPVKHLAHGYKDAGPLVGLEPAPLEIRVQHATTEQRHLTEM